MQTKNLLRATKFDASKIISFPAIFAAGTLILSASGTPDWENEAVTKINKEPARFSVFPAAGTTISLNGNWKFHFSESAENRPKNFFENDFSDDAWTTISVPSNWQLFGFGTAIYTNYAYPFKVDPPRVSGAPDKKFTAFKERNSVGSYRRDFVVPEAWNGQQILVRFDGVESAFYVWINGEKVGYSQDSYTAAEFDITKFLRAGTNKIAVEVFRWSDGSYLEDQDFFRLSGIFRDVTLFAQPKIHIRDAFFKTAFDEKNSTGTLDAKIKIRNVSEKTIPAGTRLKCEIEGDPTKISWSDEFGTHEILTKNEGKIFDEEFVVPEINPGEEVAVNFKKSFPKISPWSAEIPNLYKVSIRLGNENSSGRGNDERIFFVGFRSIKIAENGAILINGVPVKFKGVNRHEAHPDYGKALPRELAESDIRLIKAHNFNTVRCSHYPNQPVFYELCDRYGLYVMDEANVEAHGVRWGNLDLSKNPKWKNAHVERNLNMFHRAKNHASIVFWSLGNESGHGENLVAASSALREIDDSRLLHYAEFPFGSAAVDVDSAMYPSVEQVENLGKEKTSRPFFVCEFAHAMGNALGNFQEYLDAFESSPRMVGGCIWDFCDQSIRANPAKNGRYTPAPFTGTTFAYGGMFGDEPNLSNFCDNGIFLPDRTGTAKSAEVKRVFQNLKFARERDGIVVTNKFFHKPLENFSLFFVKMNPGNGHKFSKVLLPKIDAQKSAKIQFPSDFGNDDEGAIFVCADEFFAFPSKEFLDSNDLISAAKKCAAFAYFPEKNGVTESANFAAGTTENFAELEVEIAAGTTKISNENFSAKFENGMLSALEILGENLILPGFPLSFQALRAATDNDVWMKEKIEKKLRLKELRFVCKNFSAEKISAGIARAETEFSLERKNHKNGDFRFEGKIFWTIFGDGAIDVSARIYPSSKSEELPRFGFTFGVPAKFEKISYLGFGPEMNYRDRKISTWLDVFESDVDASFFRYSRPQEMGNHTGTRFVFLSEKSAGTTRGNDENSNSAGTTIAICAASELAPFEFSALSWSVPEIENAKSLDRLPRAKDKVVVNVDAFQMPLGGASCGPRPMAKYQTLSAPIALGFSISAFKNGEKFSYKKFRERHFVQHSPAIDRDSDGKIHLISSTPEAKFSFSIDGGNEEIFSAPFALKAGKIKARAVPAEKISATGTTNFVPATPAEERVFEENSTPAQWKIFSVSSEEPGSGTANFAIDGDENTFWHSAFTNAQPDYPHSICVDLGAKARFSGFVLTPRMDTNSGLIQSYVFSVSDDGENWRVVQRGNFSYHYIRKDPAVQRVDFTAPVEARFFKLDALRPVRPEKFASIAEISLILQ